MVRNHSEIKREKARMVINYKILNDNIRDDTYLIPNKDAIQRIGEAKIFRVRLGILWSIMKAIC